MLNPVHMTETMSFTVCYTLSLDMCTMQMDTYLKFFRSGFHVPVYQRFANCLVVYSPSVQCASVDTVSTTTSYYKL